LTDTLRIFERLTNAGIPAEQAEIIANEVFDIQRAGGSTPPVLAEPRYSRNPFWNLYVGNSSRHPFLNGIGTGLVLAAVEWAIVFPVVDCVVAHLRGH
jgi:hypothetical protein